MTIENLKSTLKDLHVRLESAGAVDAELADLLATLDRDIQHLLNQNGTSAEEESPLAQRAQELHAKLAAQHPQLETILRELASTLERMGI